MRLVVYTACAGRFDLPKAPAAQPHGVEFVCFSDEPSALPATAPWRVVELSGHDAWGAPRRSRLPKMLPHLYLRDWAGVDYDAALWADAYFRVVGDVRELLAYLGDGDLAARPHPMGCVYEVGEATVRRRIRTRREVDHDLDALRDAGWPRGAGAWGGGVLLWAATEAARRLGEVWEGLWRAGCGRDELTLPLAALRAGASVRALPAPRLRGAVENRSDAWLRREDRTPW